MIFHFRLLKDVNMRLWWYGIVDVLEWERVQLYLQLDGWNRMLSSAIGVVERRLGMCLIALFLVFLYRNRYLEILHFHLVVF
jgi:hypothetical protein